MLIDTHTHLNIKDFAGEEEEIIKECFDKDIWLVNVGTDEVSSKRAIEIADMYEEGVYAVVGVHPNSLIDQVINSDIIKAEEFDYEQLKELATSSPNVVGIGETGLDVYRLDGRSKEEVLQKQLPAFKESIALAKELDLAIVVHARGEKEDPYGVYDEIIRVLREEKAQRGVVHCFGGNAEQALTLAEMGFNIGITGIVTFKNADVLQSIVRAVPLEYLLIETDAPYLAPEPYRGKRNQPTYVEFIAEKIAELKGVSKEVVAEETTINARRMYVI